MNDGEVYEDVDCTAIAERESTEVATTDHRTTSAQAKVDAVAAITMSAYAKASELVLTDEERKKLAEDFPDEAFRQGANGNENLIYIEHAYLRDRLNDVLGPGQWAVIPRNRWSEQFKTSKGTAAIRVYVEAMFLVRGCFVGEAIGSMVYFPNNATQDFSDAVEGAESAALRRCACKRLGIGLQAWKKNFTDGWWQRKREPQPKPTATPRTQPPAQSKPIPPPQRVIPKRDTPIATEKHRERMIEVLAKAGLAFHAHDYLVRIGQLKEDESIGALPLEFVPTTKEQMDNLKQCIERSMPADQDGGEPPTYADGEVDNGPVPESEDVDSPDAPWRSYPLPFKWDKGATPAGTLLGKLQTKSLFALWANYVVKDDFNGKKLTPAQISKNQELRRMLDDCGSHYEFTKRD